MNIFFFMTPKSECAYLSNDTNLSEAINIMEKNRHSVLPLIDKEGRYAGILMEGDLLYNIKNNLNFDIRKANEVKIMDLDLRRYYEPIRVSATEDELVKKAISQNFVPVIDDNGIFIGLCHRPAILKYLYKQLQKAR